MTNDFILINNCIFKHTFQRTLSELFYIQISQQKVSRPTKTSEKDDLFYNTFSLKSLTHFAFLNSLDIEKIYSCNTAKNLSNFTNFPTSNWMASEKTFARHIFRHPRAALSKHFENNLYIYVYLRQKHLLQRRSKLLSSEVSGTVEGGGGGESGRRGRLRLNN